MSPTNTHAPTITPTTTTTPATSMSLARLINRLVPTLALAKLLVALGFAVAIAITSTTPVRPETNPAENATTDINLATWDAWLVELRTEAASQGISQATITAALTDITPIKRVIELDRSQPEFTLTFADYIARVVPPERQAKARQRLTQHRPLLDEVGMAYGVQPRFIVALWGIETDFGRTQGTFQVIPALATLAHDGRRASYFRRELLDALHIIDQGHITAQAMLGSWAGAMGQSQFMPSTFRNYAEDYNQDGRRDIWTTQADVFASAANYLAGVGWRDDMTWGRKVLVPTSLDGGALHDAKTWKRLPEWAALGVVREDGSPLPTRALSARLVLPDYPDITPQSDAYLVYNNYEALLKWNRSNYFAIAVGTLADSMRRR